MKKLLILSLSAITLFVTKQAAAQDQQAMQKWMEYMTPGDMHKMLESYNGNWTADVTMYMPGQPPMTNKMTSTNTMILGGRYQQSVEKGSFNGMPFEGISTLGYDNLRKVFVNTWVDNFGTGVLVMEGGYDPTTKTINLYGSETDPMSGKTMKVHQTMKMVDNNNQLWQMFDVKDGKETKTMEIKATRA
jgi:hypothetical protein